ncbi:hypothetical protein PIB30_075839 [Stylosanthes scabra]|uniref:Uncharacterized protein n=1 Tax=Stylosanthes scabra TaxID=79078 RepID=A0ABU6ZNT0_9FABA|nr:hypothetical protein [Stylosanthes scabra]
MATLRKTVASTAGIVLLILTVIRTHATDLLLVSSPSSKQSQPWVSDKDRSPLLPPPLLLVADDPPSLSISSGPSNEGDWDSQPYMED